MSSPDRCADNELVTLAELHPRVDPSLQRFEDRCVQRIPRICWERPHAGLRVKAIDGWGVIITTWSRTAEGEVVTQFTLGEGEVDELIRFLEDPGA